MYCTSCTHTATAMQASRIPGRFLPANSLAMPCVLDLSAALLSLYLQFPSSHSSTTTTTTTTTSSSSSSTRGTRSKQPGKHTDTHDQRINGDVPGRRGEGRVDEGEAGARQGAVAAVPAARGGAGVDALAGALDHRPQPHLLRRHHVLQQLPCQQEGARRPVRRPLPPTLLLPAAPPEPARRTILRHAGEDGRPGVGQGGARPPGVAPRHLHVDARRRAPPPRQHAQPPLHRPPPRAAVRLRPDRGHLPPLGARRQRALHALHPELHLRGRLRRALRPPGRHALGAPLQLDHLHQQGGRRDHAALRHRRQPRARHPAPRQQLRPHRRLPHRVPPRLRAPHAPALRVDGALQPPHRHTLHLQEVPRLPVGAHGRRPPPRRRRIRDRSGHGVPGVERQRKLPVVPLPQLRPHRELDLPRQLIDRSSNLITQNTPARVFPVIHIFFVAYCPVYIHICR